MGKSINLEIDIDVKGIGRKDINNFTKTEKDNDLSKVFSGEDFKL